MVNPISEQLWAESVGVEERSSGATQAKAMLARGADHHHRILGAMPDLVLIRPTRMSRIRTLVDTFRVGRASTGQEDAFSRRSQKNKG